MLDFSNFSKKVLSWYRNKHMGSVWAARSQESDWPLELLWSGEADYLHYNWTRGGGWSYNFRSLSCSPRFVVSTSGLPMGIHGSIITPLNIAITFVQGKFLFCLCCRHVVGVLPNNTFYVWAGKCVIGVVNIYLLKLNN